MTSSPRLRRWTALYTAVLIGIIVGANTGYLPVSRWLHHIPWGDKLGHFLLMGGLAFLLNLSFGLRRWRPYQLDLLLGSLLVALAATAEEISQYWLANRRFDPWDLAADLAGILCFDLLARLYGSFREKSVVSGSPGSSSTSG